MPRLSLIKSLVVLVCAVLSVSCGAAAEAIPPDSAARFAADLATGKALFFRTGPAFGDLEAAPAAPGGSRINTTLRSTGGYVVKLTGRRSQGIVRLEFSLKRADGKAFKTFSYGVQADTKELPILKNAPYYHAENSPVSGTRHIPVVCQNDADGISQIVLGFANQVHPAEVHQNGDTWSISRPASWERITGNEIKDGIYLDVSKQYWFDALKAYAKYADEYRGFKPRPIPLQAYEPVWCSWYTVGIDVNQEIVWENARIAKSLGIGTMLIDCGWDAPGDPLKRPNHTYGDRVAYQGKFPDMTGLVDRIHKELGMAVELWAAPWHVQKGARAAREIDDVRDYSKETPADWLCPRCAKTGDFLAQQMARCIEEYHLDGMWWDFLDSVPFGDCKGEALGIHKHDYQTQGEGYNAAMTKIMDAVHRVRPDALIETRLQNSNINNKIFVNVMETFDTPLSPNDNRNLLVNIRTFSDGIVPKTDPTLWQRANEEGRKECPDQLVGQYMATMIIAGVPAISQDFRKMSESNRRVVKAYLDFYREHKWDMLFGDFRPVGYVIRNPNLVIQGRKATYLYSATQEMPKLRLRKAPTIIYMLSACEKPGVAFEIDGLRPGKYVWEAKDSSLQTTSKGEVEVTGAGFTWEAPVPPGGMLELRPL